jgi:hypothetical protein
MIRIMAWSQFYTDVLNTAHHAAKAIHGAKAPESSIRK